MQDTQIDAAAAQAAGVQLEEPMFEDYFGFAETRKWFFPDGRQYIEYKIMDEGKKAQFQKLTNRDVVLERTTGNARMKVDPASERHALLENSVTGWSLYRKNGAGVFEPVPFSIGSPGATFNQWLNSANPKLVEELEFEIRKANPWLQADMSVEDIDKEMDRLRELREAAVVREQGEAGSGVR